MRHKLYGSCVGEFCGPCGRDASIASATQATHKLGEEIMDDDEQPERHNLTQYVCCEHFRLVVGGSCA